MRGLWKTSGRCTGQSVLRQHLAGVFCPMERVYGDTVQIEEAIAKASSRLVCWMTVVLERVSDAAFLMYRS